jgi:hypothetical protein
MTETHLSFDEIRAAAHSAAQWRRDARANYERYSKEAADAERDYRKRLAIEFTQYRAEGKGAGESELLAHGKAADDRHRRDIAQGQAKAALLRIEELERDQATLRQLAEWSKDLEVVG